MNQQQFENYLKAGKITSETKKYLQSFIKPEMLLLEIAEKIENKIQELGGQPAFPVNTSLNEVAAHYTPITNDETKAQGLVKIDFGVEVDGYIADNAITFDFTENQEHRQMMQENRKILDETLDYLNYESKVCDIGNSISKSLKNFNVIQNLTGHSLDQYQIHTDPSIPNTENKIPTPLKETAIAIEPFLTTGIGSVIEGPASEIFMLISEKNTRDSESRKILAFIKENYQTKPFCKRWLDKQGFKTNFALKNLVREGIIHNFPVLIEKTKKPVSQFEETVVFHNGKKIVTTK